MGALEGCVALVTGAGSGIGRGISLAFADAGADVVVLARNAEKGARVVAEVVERGARALHVAADVKDRDAVAAAVNRAVEHFGRLDIVVNNAQQSRPARPLEEHESADFRLAFESGVVGSFHVMIEALPHLKTSRGRIINIVSGGRPAGLAPYLAAKAGQVVLTQAAAREWGPYGITTNAIFPLAKTESLDRYELHAPDRYAELVADVPLGRVGHPEHDIGAAAVFLASPGGAYLNGAVLPVDGGMGA